MKWFIYLKRTPLAQIRADWAEYRALRHKCVQVRAQKRVAKEKITMMRGMESENYKLSCISYLYYEYAPTCMNNGDGVSNGLLFMRYSVCRKFNGYSDDRKCNDLNCPYVQSNHEYVAACERYKLARQACRDFWRAKFAQACQNLK